MPNKLSYTILSIAIAGVIGSLVGYGPTTAIPYVAGFLSLSCCTLTETLSPRWNLIVVGCALPLLLVSLLLAGLLALISISPFGIAIFSAWISSIALSSLESGKRRVVSHERKIVHDCIEGPEGRSGEILLNLYASLLSITILLLLLLFTPL